MDKKEEQTKKEVPVLERSVMLTRFKLSQQKRKLREKDNRLSLITQALKKPHSSKATKHKHESPQKSPTKSNKERQSQDKKVEKFELRPNKLKRNKVIKKIMLKPKNDLKVIGWTSGVKRKRTVSEKNVKSPSVKRKRKKHKKSTSSPDSSYEDNRSQSPVYSELGFEEIIRMADENQNLDDEDLMEILTCPSPVWWEDPPDGEYIEGPIVLKTNPIASFPNFAAQRRSKHSRKRTPQKMIVDSVEYKLNDNTSMNADLLNTELLNNKTTSDVKFSKKRSKLESLLSTIKNKRNQLRDKCDTKIVATEIVKSEKDISEESKKTVDKTHTKCDTEEMSDSIGDSSFLDISLLDNDGLKHLENIKIPIEGHNEKTIENKVKPTNKRNISTSVPLKPKIFANEHFKMLNNDKPRSIPRIKNKKLKILNIKKVSPGLLTVKSPQDINNIQMSNPQEKESIKNDPSLFKIDLSLDINNEIMASKKEINNLSKSLETEDSLWELKTNNDALLKDRKEESTANDNEEYITVFEIINSDDERTKDEESAKNSDVETEIDSPALTKNSSSREENKLNSYYKQCKNSRMTSKKTAKRADKKSNNVKKNKKDKKLCDDCNLDTKYSIIVPSTNDIKYCLKCSSIFDADVCSYCIKKRKSNSD